MVNLVVGIIFFALVLLAFSSYIVDPWYRQLAETMVCAFAILLIFMTMRNGHDEYLYYIIDGEFIVRRSGKDDISQLLCEVEGKNIAHMFRARDLKSEKYATFHARDYAGKFAFAHKYVLLVVQEKGLEKITISPSGKTLELLAGICEGEIHFHVEHEISRM